ncbi:tyrosine-type recombinase/integrase [Actinomadura algeriensis]|uniref:Integrase n=1 Tax=Actinomadura algeriensis TaxID=1679523 RepID=A0ABR9JID4_9ACTN|nr:site-specific integrase [Actinomadura algeriensis]MBE1530193.1 integrase [Actinomadura algeriensis]
MGFTRKRTGPQGNRYQALYDDARGVRQTAGTFTTRKEADRAWQRAETRIAEGKAGDPRRARQTFRTYVEERWFPNHRIEASTRQDYAYALAAHVMPYFGDMKLRDITSETVREWITHLKKQGASAYSIKYCKTAILNAIFTTAVNDGILVYHPSRGVKTDPVPEKPRQIITAEQFARIYEALPTPDAKLLVETDIESGLRWGELTELRVKDLDFATGILTVSRAVVQLVPKYHPEGRRFLVNDYPKGKRYRRLKLSPQIVAKLKAHTEARNLAPDDLFFSRRPQPPKLELVDPESLTFEAFNGRTYTHGTITAYNLGKCKCDHCRAAYAAYRAKRRAQGRDNPRNPRVDDDDPHIPASWFRNHCWHPAREAADLGWSPRIHDLRHAHASWLLAGGADLQVVKERLGHRKISTTERYLHTLPSADETALEALNKIRAPQNSPEAAPDLGAQLEEAQAKIAQLQAVLADQLVARHTDERPNLRSV